MAKYLMVVESPAKAKTLTKLLTNENSSDTWDIIASKGHITQMASDNTLGFDKDTLEIEYVLTNGGKEFLSRVRSLGPISSYDTVYIASDLDREGEAIAEQIRQRLKLGDGYSRVTFGSITKSEVLKEISTGYRKVNKELLAAQESRRILDRIVGWDCTSALTCYLGKLSPVGRVQSQFVKLLVDRERKIDNFQPTDHWTVRSFLGGEGSQWKSELDINKSGLAETVFGGQKCWIDKEAATVLVEKLEKLEVLESEKKEVEQKPPMPFKTSTLQQAASNQLGITSTKVDEIAQELYQSGHITYIRTDSTEISDDGFADIYKHAKEHDLPVMEEKQVGKKSALSQEAHECIRPTDFSFDGESLTGHFKEVYQMIWVRTVASQLEPATRMKTTTVMKGEVDGKEYIFNATGSVPAKKGWRVLLEEDFSESSEDLGSKKDVEQEEASNPVPVLEVGDIIEVDKNELISKVTKPPAYLDESSFSKLCENSGISRPGTYSGILERIISHKYVERAKSKGRKQRLKPTKKAYEMVDATHDVFKIMDIDFTKEMEDSLDKIANGKMQHEEFCKDFFKVIESEIEQLRQKPGACKENPCSECGSPMIRFPAKGRPNSYWWLCPNNECNARSADFEGKPATKEQVEQMRLERQRKREERLAPFMNDDGTPKFPCPTDGCGMPLIRIPSKKYPDTYFWGCSSPKSSNCNYTAFDDKEKEVPVHDKQAWIEEKREEEKRQFSDEDGNPLYPCPKCKSHVVSKTGKFGTFWACVKGKSECGFRTQEGDDGKPILDKEEKKAEKIRQLSNPDGTPKWPCGACGGHLDKKAGKEPGRYWFGCMSYPKCKQTYPEDNGEPNYNVGEKGSSGKGSRPKKAKRPRPSAMKAAGK